MLHHAPAHQVSLRLIPAGEREAAALREMFQRLEPFLPLLQFMSDAAQKNPKLANKALELPQTGIAIPLRDATRLLSLMQQIGTTVLNK